MRGPIQRRAAPGCLRLTLRMKQFTLDNQPASQSKIACQGFKHVHPVALQNRAVNSRAERYQRRSPLQRPTLLNKSCLAKRNPSIQEETHISEALCVSVVLRGSIFVVLSREVPAHKGEKRSFRLIQFSGHISGGSSGPLGLRLKLFVFRGIVFVCKRDKDE